MLLTGVIEGFYGPPWTTTERLSAFDQMAAWGLGLYLYGPKDDLHHRAIWREPYAAADAASLAALVGACHARGLRFVYGIGPGLDIRYGDLTDRQYLRGRCAQMLDIGVDGVALLFDDIPDRIDEADLARWGSLAAAQADVANDTFAFVRVRKRDAVAAFCPTPYCGRMATAQLGGAGYLDTLGAALHPDIDIFWTGPEIVSSEITVAHVRAVAARLRRKPFLWDNLHANDYDGRRMLLGPYSGRPLALRDEVRGILTNPNTEFPLDFMALRTLAMFVHAGDAWDERGAHLSALREWLPSFETVSGPVEFDDLVLLADCYYLPCEEGPRAEALRADAERALTDSSPEWRDHARRFLAEAMRLRDLCGRLATLKQRALFHALSRRIWDLREELDLLVRGVQARLGTADGLLVFRSDFHLPRTYRGGMVARLQRLLTQHPDGTFTAGLVPHGRARRAGPTGVSDRPALVVASPTGGGPMTDAVIRLAQPGDQAGAYHVCLKTGDAGSDGGPVYREDPDALGRLFVGPYLAFEPALSLILEDAQGICGYALAALDSRAFYARYDAEWRPDLCARYPLPAGDPATWTRVQEVYGWYHHPDYFCPEPHAQYPSHLHIDLLPRAQGHGYGRQMMEQLMDRLRERGSPGVHLGMWARNHRAYAFYQRRGFHELARVGSPETGSLYLGRRLSPDPAAARAEPIVPGTRN
jgi:protein O-GlcNAcase/histone acetyltransferase